MLGEGWRTTWDRIRDRTRTGLALALLGNVGWIVAGTFVSRGLALAGWIVVARVTGPHGFGEVGVIQSTVALFTALLSAGLGMTATKYVAESRVVDPSRTGRIIALCQVVAWVTGLAALGLLVALAGWIAGDVLWAPELTPLLRVAALLVFLTASVDVVNGTLVGFEQFRPLALVNGLSAAICLPLTVACTLTAGVQGAVWALVGTAAVQYLVLLLTLFHVLKGFGIRPRYAGCFAEWRLLTDFSLPSLLGATLVSYAFWQALTLIVRQPGGLEELGVFNAAYQLRTVFVTIPVVLGQMYLSVMARVRAENDPARVAQVFRHKLAVSGLAVIGTVVGVWALSPVLLGGYGRAFAERPGPLVVLALSLVGYVFTDSLFVLAQSKGRLWWVFALNVVWAVLLTGAAVVLRREGALGLAWACFLAFTGQAVVAACFSRAMLRRVPVSAAAGYRACFWLMVLLGKPFGGLRPRRLTHWLARRAYGADRPRPEQYRWHRDRFGLRYLVHPHYYIDYHIIAFGCFDEPASNYIRKHVAPGMVCLDVGANIGVLALLMARRAGPTGRVCCFEPVPRLYDRLQDNVEGNGLGGTIRAFRTALADVDGTMSMAVAGEEETNQGTSSLVGQGDPRLRDAAVVEVRTLDRFVEEEGLARVDFIKLDIEGAEPLFLDGARATLAQFRPDLLIEILPHNLAALRKTSRDLALQLEDLGYELFELTASGEPGARLEAARLPEGYANEAVLCRPCLRPSKDEGRTREKSERAVV
jgi:FkbM family methyltransferase